MNALIAKLLHLGVKHRYIAVADNPFRVFCKFCEVEFIDDADGAVAATGTEDGVDVVSVEIVLQYVGTEVVVTASW